MYCKYAYEIWKPMHSAGIFKIQMPVNCIFFSAIRLPEAMPEAFRAEILFFHTDIARRSCLTRSWGAFMAPVSISDLDLENHENFISWFS